MKCERLFETVDSLADKYLSVWEDVCNIESPTNYKKGVDEVGAYFAEFAKKFGWEVEVLEQPISGNCLCLTLNPNATTAPVSLSGHIDTVHPVGSFGSPAVRIEGDKIYGPGVVDCKGGAVAALMAMEALSLCGFTSRPVQLLLQSDEENSSITSNKETVKFMAEKSKNAIAFLNCEGEHPGKLTMERKGIVRYCFEIQGIAAHSAMCAKQGAGAIREAAYKIIELEKWKDHDGITCNCGVIQGGTVANTVPEFCAITADIRYQTAQELAEIEKHTKEIADTSYVEGTSCNLVLQSHRVSMELNEKNQHLFERICEIYKENGLTVPAMGKANGGSDAADMSSYGIPTVDSIGIYGKHIHSLDEYAYIPSLAETAKRLAAIVYSI